MSVKKWDAALQQYVSVEGGIDPAVLAEVAANTAARHDAATAGTGISIAGQEITNSDRGSVAVTSHEEANNHALLHASGSDAETVTSMAALINSSGAITTPADADKWGFRDSVSGLFAHITWANMLAAILTAVSATYATIAGLATKLSIVSPYYTQQTGNFTISTAMIGKRVPVNATATVTIPAYTGFAEGDQLIIVNNSDTATFATLSGTFYSPGGNKIAQGKDAHIQRTATRWEVTGGLST